MCRTVVSMFGCGPIDRGSIPRTPNSFGFFGSCLGCIFDFVTSMFPIIKYHGQSRYWFGDLSHRYGLQANSAADFAANALCERAAGSWIMLAGCNSRHSQKCRPLPSPRLHSLAVEHSLSKREVSGSNPLGGCPSQKILFCLDGGGGSTSCYGSPTPRPFLRIRPAHH